MGRRGRGRALSQRLVRRLVTGALRPAARLGAVAARRRGAARGEPVRRVLLVATAWIGDTFWATQVLPRIREAWPGVEVHAATRARQAGLWPDDVVVHAVEAVPSDNTRERVSWLGLLDDGRRLRRLGLDLALDLTGNRYTAALVALSGAPRSAGPRGDVLEGVYGRLAESGAPDAHLSQRPQRVLDAALGVERAAASSAPPRSSLVPAPASPWGPVAAAHGVEGDASFALLAPGAGWAGKRWPVERFAALARELERRGLRVVVTGGPDEAALVEQVVAGSPSACASTGSGVRDLAALAARARLVVGNDSAPVHLAAAAGTPTIALFGPTNPARYRPLGPRVTVLRHACPDRPEGAREHCHDVPAWPCPASCWDGLPLEAVVAASSLALVDRADSST